MIRAMWGADDMPMPRSKDYMGCFGIVLMIFGAMIWPSTLHAEAINSKFCPFIFEVRNIPVPKIEESTSERLDSQLVTVTWPVAGGNAVLVCTRFIDEYALQWLNATGCAITPVGEHVEICDRASRWDGHERLTVYRDLSEGEGNVAINYAAIMVDKGVLRFHLRGDPPYEPSTDRLAEAVTATREFIASVKPESVEQ